MKNPIIRIHDIETGEIVDREMNDVELEQYQIDQENNKIEKALIKTKEANKKAILDRLGLTADELKTILG